MAVNLFHQCGHHSVWNRDSFEKDGCGDGLIISPVHVSREKLESDVWSKETREKSFFDPQFYLPNSQKNNLQSYHFFPDTISNGFVTSDYSLYALEAAKLCVKFQLEQNFNRVVIPARHFSDMIPDYTEQQDKFTVHSFLQVIDDLVVDKPIFLTVPLTRMMIVNDTYRTDILNWITSYPRLDGIYLLVEDDRNTKQITDFDFLTKYLTVVKELTDTGLTVVIGHANTEGLLFSLIDNCELTFGAYENTRIFSTDKFVVSDEDKRGPKARIYLPGLLNWIQFSHAKQIRSEASDLWEKIYTVTDYAELALDAAKDPHFTNPGLYKHFFISNSRQVSELSGVNINDRHVLLRKWLKSALDVYSELDSRVIDLDKHGNGDHIQVWLDAINWYFRNHISP